MHTPRPGIRVTESESDSATDSEHQFKLAANFASDRPRAFVGYVCPEGGRTVTPGPGCHLANVQVNLAQ